MSEILHLNAIEDDAADMHTCGVSCESINNATRYYMSDEYATPRCKCGLSLFKLTDTAYLCFACEMREDELPNDITQAEYNEWWDRSWLVDGVRVGPLLVVVPQPRDFPPVHCATPSVLPAFGAVLCGAVLAGALVCLVVAWAMVRRR